MTIKLLIAVLGLVALATTTPKTILKSSSKINLPISHGLKPTLSGGHEATPHSFPYQAFLLVRLGSIGFRDCGGALISSNYVLTTAFCIVDSTEIQITLGAHRYSENEDTQIALVSTEYTVHEDYDPDEFINDVAVIRLPMSVHLTPAIQPIFLPSQEDASKDYTDALSTVSGWGYTDSSGTTLTEALHTLQLTVISNADCEDIYGSLASSVLCTSGVNNVGLCGGDMGDPLVTDGVLIGVGSFDSGSGCSAGYPSGFTRVTSFLDWISVHTDV